MSFGFIRNTPFSVSEEEGSKKRERDSVCERAWAYMVEGDGFWLQSELIRQKSINCNIIRSIHSSAYAGVHWDVLFAAIPLSSVPVYQKLRLYDILGYDTIGINIMRGFYFQLKRQIWARSYTLASIDCTCAVVVFIVCGWSEKAKVNVHTPDIILLVGFSNKNDIAQHQRRHLILY